MKSAIGAAIALAMTFSIPATAHDGASGIVLKRMDNMKTIGDQIKMMVPMMKGALPYDPAQVANSAKIIQNRSGRALTDLFPKGSDGHPSEALPEIWEDWEKFSDIAGQLESSAATLVRIGRNNGSEDDFKDALSGLLKTCKSCHNNFREK